MNKKIVITGISSDLMKKVVMRIDLSEYDVIGLTRDPDKLSIKGTETLKADLLEFEEYSSLLENCHMLIHGAAITHTKREKEYYRINLDATKKLVDAAKEYGVDRFVFVSSNTAGKTSGAYGLTKLLAEEYIKQRLNSWLIFRITEVFGGNKNEGIEKLIDDSLNKSMVLCPTNVPSKLCPVHIDDAAQQMFDHIFNQDELNKTVIVSGPKAYSFSEVVSLVQEISKRRVRIIPLSRGFMYAIKWIAKISPINIGIVPDQVDRLYSVKEIKANRDSLIGLEEYVNGLVEKKAIT